MKMKKFLAVCLAATMAASLAGCGSSAGTTPADDAAATDDAAADTSDAAADEAADSSLISYADLKLGEDCTDLSAAITVFNHRTDLQGADYPGKTWDQYLADFNEMYPNITVEVSTESDYAESALLRLQGGNWGDKVIAEPSGMLIGPREGERVGDVSNVVFTNGAIARDNGDVYIYYASSDTRMHVATTTIDRLTDYVFHTPADPGRSVAGETRRFKRCTDLALQRESHYRKKSGRRRCADLQQCSRAL